MDKKGLFLREATGLVRTIGIREAFLINISILNPGVGFIYIMFALSFGANANLIGSLVIAAITGVFLALAYSQLVATMPRSGGDYVFTSRLLHPIIGAAVGGAIIFVFLDVVGTNTAIFANTFTSSLFNSLGSVFNSKGLMDFGTTITQHWPTFIIAGLLIVIAGLVTALGTRRVSQVMMALFVIGMIGFFTSMGLYLFTTHASFIANYNAASGNNAFQAIIDAAKANGFTPGMSLSSTLLAIPLCAMIYWGFTSANYPAGELKSASTTLRRSVLIALGTGLVLFIIAWSALQRMVSLDFLQSVSFLSVNHPDVLASITASPTDLGFYATVVSQSGILKLLIPLSYMCWVGVFVLAYYLVISRVLFALSFDRLLPEWLSETRANNVPVNSIIASMIGMLVLLALQVFYSGILAGIFNATFILAIVYTLVGISVTILPFVKPELYEASPKIAGWKLGGVPGISLIGGISTLCTLAIVYLCMAQPQFIGPASAQALIFTVVMFGWGIVAYLIEKSRYKKATGLDLEMAVKEIPPE